jgi:hypothetical protein
VCACGELDSRDEDGSGCCGASTTRSTPNAREATSTHARWQRRWRDQLCGEFVFVEQPAGPVAMAQAIERKLLTARRRFANRRLFERRMLGERAVRPMLVVVLRVDVNDVLEVAAAEDQEPVEALARQA